MTITRASALLVFGWVVGAGVLAAGCATHRALGLDALPGREHSGVASERGLRIVGYTTTDGVQHAFEGRARAIGDSIEFEPHASRWRGLERNVAAARFRLPRDSVATLAATDPVMSGLVVTSVLLALVVVAFGMIVSSRDMQLF